MASYWFQKEKKTIEASQTIVNFFTADNQSLVCITENHVYPCKFDVINNNDNTNFLFHHFSSFYRLRSRQTQPIKT